MSVFGVRKEFSDVNTPKTSISASTGVRNQSMLVVWRYFQKMLFFLFA